LSPEEQFERIADAGYDGVCLDPAIHEIEHCLSLASLFQSHNLGCMVNAFPHSADEIRPLLELARELNACHVNALGTQIPLTVREGAKLAEYWLRDAQDVGISLLFETHRDSLLNDLGYTVQLLEAVSDMRLCADLSHFVVDREIRLPLNHRDETYFKLILERSECFQGRVATSEQVQVPIGFPQHQIWTHQFREWWKTGIHAWRARHADNARLVFLCELGPPPYAITDGEGLELSNRWDEALTIRSWIEEICAEFQDSE